MSITSFTSDAILSVVVFITVSITVVVDGSRATFTDASLVHEKFGDTEVLTSDDMRGLEDCADEIIMEGTNVVLSSGGGTVGWCVSCKRTRASRVPTTALKLEKYVVLVLNSFLF